jgi:hypothetical protein
VNTIEKLALILLLVLFGGCKDKESEPVEPNVQNTKQKQNLPNQEQSTSSTLEINLRYSGHPIQEFTSVEPAFSLNNRDTHEKGIQPKIDYSDGHYAIHELLPGNYVLFASINANPDNPGRYPGYPGDFFYRDSRLVIPSDGDIRLDIDLQQVIHLILPQDNAGFMDKWGKKGQEMVTFASPVEFAWDALDEGTLYDFKIFRMQSEPYKSLEHDVVKETTQATRVSLDLATSADNEFYSFSLRATKGQFLIGGLVLHGQRGYGTDFRFRVK